LTANALTLGRARGAAWIGQPLDLIVSVQLDAGQTDTGVCAEADVFHADSRQDPARVRVTSEVSAQPDTFNVRIQSPALVDEPVVTVYLRAGCGQKSSRKYVLLADYPSEPTAPLSRAPEPVAPVVPLVSPQSGAPNDTAPTKTAPVASTPEPQRPPKPPAERKPVPPAPPKAPAKKPEPAADKPVPVPAAPAKPVASGKPRLKLDPLENLTERIKTLESTTTAMPPENTASDAARMESLQSDVRALLDQAAKNEASLTAMRERMEKAEAERVPMGVVYGLVALVIACLFGLAYLWTRRPKSPVWEQGAPLAPVQPPRTTAVPLQPEPDLDVDVNLMDLDEESFSKLMEVKPNSSLPASGKRGA
jgi:hypothetical protein